jgi:hypothetical protein
MLAKYLICILKKDIMLKILTLLRIYSIFKHIGENKIELTKTFSLLLSIEKLSRKDILVITEDGQKLSGHFVLANYVDHDILT